MEEAGAGLGGGREEVDVPENTGLWGEIQE